jgi:hypothetical protein
MTGLWLTLLLGAAAPERVLVFDIGGDALAPTEAALVRDALASALAENRDVEVLTNEDLRRVLDMEAERQASGCADDTCLAELGAAMGASRVLYGTASRLGDGWVLNAVLLDPQGARAIARASTRTDSVEQLVDAAPQVVDALGLAAPLPVLTIAGAAVSAVGGLGVGALGVAWLVLYGAAQDPRGDPDTKQAWLDHRTTLLVGAGAFALVLGAGAALLTVGIVTE